jgi:hypothetical protein
VFWIECFGYPFWEGTITDVSKLGTAPMSGTREYIITATTAQGARDTGEAVNHWFVLTSNNDQDERPWRWCAWGWSRPDNLRGTPEWVDVSMAQEPPEDAQGAADDQGTAGDQTAAADDAGAYATYGGAGGVAPGAQ